ncbi:hypothetical protein K523DRAFT_297173 [Schizophyllum commune Tattone D]|nr:hypothetical protein K523DRAFT_297173 [Schizophyllum commune Tattone D]
MGVDRPITEFFRPLKENKRGRKRRREQEEADESPDAKARKAGPSKASFSVLRSTVTANKGKKAAPVDANRVDESAVASGREVGPSSSVSPQSIGLERSSSKPLLLDAGTTLSTPIGSKIGALTLHTPPLTGHPPEKRQTAVDARAAAAPKRLPDRYALPTPVTLPRRRTSRESPPPGPESSQDPPSSPPFKFPFRFPEEIVPSSQPTQDLLRSPRKPTSYDRGDDTVFKVPRTPVSRRHWGDEVPSSQSPIALDSDDCVGTSQSQERFPLLGWRSRSASPVKPRSPVKASPLEPVSRHEVASSVADEDTSYQRLFPSSQPISSPQRQPLSSPQRQPMSSPPGSPSSRPLSQYTETEPSTYDLLYNLKAAEGKPADDGDPREDGNPAEGYIPSQSSTQITETIPGTYDDIEKWPKRPQLNAPPMESQTQPMTCDNWKPEDFAHLRRNVVHDGTDVEDVPEDSQHQEVDRREAHDEHDEPDGGAASVKQAGGDAAKASQTQDDDSQVQTSDSQAEIDDSQAGLEDSFGSDFSLGLYTGEGSFPDDFPESLKL